MARPLDSRQLNAFTTLARLGSFTLTARELSLTQSAISHAIKSLEEDLGSRLVYKTGKRTLLTHAGKRLQIHAENILLEMAQARARIGSMDSLDRGQLRIGCGLSASQFILPTVLREFKECFPKYAISVIPGDSPALLGQLEQNRIDLAICLKPDRTPRLLCRDLFRDELAFLISPLHPWAVSGRPDRKEMGKENYILLPRQSLTFQMVESWFLEQGIKLSTFIELSSIETIKELVKLGLGVGVGTAWIAKPELEMGSIRAVPFGRKKMIRSWAVLHLKDRPISLAEETFIGLCESVCGDLQTHFNPASPA